MSATENRIKLLAKARGEEYKRGSIRRDIVRFEGRDYVIGETKEPNGVLDLDIIYPIDEKDLFDEVMSNGLQIERIIH